MCHPDLSLIWLGRLCSEDYGLTRRSDWIGICRLETTLDANGDDEVETMASLRIRAERSASWHQRRLEHAMARLGTPRSFYMIVAFAASWTGFNLGAARLGVRAFDPPPFV